jgi:hypothetical protein
VKELLIPGDIKSINTTRILKRVLKLNLRKRALLDDPEQEV